MKKTLMTSGIVSATSLLAGTVFKFLHLPGTNVLLVCGILIFAFIFLPLFFSFRIRESKHTRDKTVLTLGLITGLTAGFSVLFKLMWWPYANVLTTTSLLLLLIVFIPVYFFSGLRDPNTKANTIVTSLLLVCGAAMMLSLTHSRFSHKTQSTLGAIEQQVQSNLSGLRTKNTETENRLRGMNAVALQGSAMELVDSGKKLSDFIVEMKANLIAHTEHISTEKARTLSSSDLSESNNGSLMQQSLENDPDYSRKQLLAMVEKYNATILSKKNGVPAEPLIVKDEIFESGLLPVTVFSLTQLEYQVEVSRQAVLNYMLGAGSSKGLALALAD